MIQEMKNIALGTALVAAGGAVVLTGTSAQAQTFIGTEADSAIRAAYSTVSVGGSTHSYALEVVLPDTVYFAGSYTLTLSWSSTNPDEALLTAATLDPGAASVASAGLDGAIAAAINDATASGNYENVEAIIEKTVGPEGAVVVFD